MTRLRKFRSNALTCWFVDVLTKKKLAVIRMIRTIAYFFYRSREGWDIKRVKGRNVKGNYLKMQNIR